MSELVLFSSGFPAALIEAPASARMKFLEFFTAQIRNVNTRRYYAKAAVEFLGWCEHRGARSLDAMSFCI